MCRTLEYCPKSSCGFAYIRAASGMSFSGAVRISPPRCLAETARTGNLKDLSLFATLTRSIEFLLAMSGYLLMEFYFEWIEKPCQDLVLTVTSRLSPQSS